ncbi:hypothetical protein BGX28_002057 [Mortierella sp. GBA30]|nr:hypothetical protein BGX28_002057 [Mortierella sp. GBA30]
MSTQAHSNSSMNRVNPEIAALIGRCLSGNSRVALQVSEHWHDNLQPLLGASDIEHQWHHHPQFLIRPSIAVEDDNASEKARSPYRFVRHIDYQTGDSNLEQERIRLITLQSVLKKTSRLHSLSLKADWWFGPMVDIASELHQLRYFRRLDIDVPGFNHKQDEDGGVLSLISGLEELYMPQNSERCYFAGLCSEPQLPPMAAWKMRKLRIEKHDMHMLKYCRQLRKLAIYSSSHDHQFSARPIMACQKLEALRVTVSKSSYNDQYRVEGLIETLMSLKRLKTLVYPVHSLEEVSFLCSPEALQEHDILNPKEGYGSGYTEASPSEPIPRVEYQPILPLLEHIEFSDVRMKLDVCMSCKLHQSLANILRTRPLLKTFIFRGHGLNPSRLFPGPGMEAQQEWQSKKLETLSVQFTRKLYALPLEERCEQWRSVYRQVGKLPELKYLSIKCDGLEKSVASGLLELDGARSLQHLTLSDRQVVSWSKDEILMLLMILPSLCNLFLAPVGNPDDIARWIKESGRDVKFEGKRF